MKGKLLLIIFSLLINIFLVSVLPTKPLTPPVILIDLCSRPRRNFVNIVEVSEFKTDGKKKVKKDKWRRQSLTKYSVAICCVFGNFCCSLNKQNTVVIITLYLFDIFSLRHPWHVLNFWESLQRLSFVDLWSLLFLLNYLQKNSDWLGLFRRTKCLL